jgi:hypothetical protein
MAESEAQYRLVVFDELENAALVRDVFVEVTGTHPTDAMQWIAKLPGPWPKPLTEAHARGLLAKLFELEIAAEAWRVDQFPDLGMPRTIHAVSCDDTGFKVQGLRGEPTHWVPWDKFELISAGLIDSEDEFRDVSPPGWLSAINSGAKMLMGRNPAASRRVRAMRIPRDPVPEVLIVRRDPRITFRVVAREMNYSYLGDRLKPSAAENFPVFLHDLCTRAIQAYLTNPTRDMLEGSVHEEDVFANSQGLYDYTLHRLLWSWYRRDGDAEDA